MEECCCLGLRSSKKALKFGSDLAGTTKKRLNGHHLKSHVKEVYAYQMILFSVLIHLIYSNCTRQRWQITFAHPLQGLLGLWCDWRRKHCRF